MDDRALISVCVCTYKRLPTLEALLSALALQRELDCAFEIIVVDNDAEGSAKALVNRFQRCNTGALVRYFIEPERNIALARNRSVAEATGTWFAFIDDDETPTPTWLSKLLMTLRSCRADGVFGPVIPVLPADAPSWICHGGFFERPRHLTGDCVPADEVRTSNAMIWARLLDGRSQPFDPRYGRTGGSDSQLFGKLLSERAYFVWCDEAIVSEAIPRSRASMHYILRRAMAQARNWGTQRRASAGKQFYCQLLLRGLANLAVGLSMALLLFPVNGCRSVWWLRKGATGLGQLLACTPYCHELYSTS